jgi:hypothetical protein
VSAHVTEEAQTGDEEIKIATEGKFIACILSNDIDRLSK